MSKAQELQQSPFQALLTGLVGGGPGPGDELGDATHAAARLELSDDVEQVREVHVAIDAEQAGVVDERTRV